MVYRNGLWWYKGNAFGTLRNALIAHGPDDWTGPGEPGPPKISLQLQYSTGSGGMQQEEFT